MITQRDQRRFASAVQDFRDVRRKAEMEAFFSQLRGTPAELLSYEDVRKKLKASGQVERGLQDIPLDDIVGSVGRYRDFSRSFLPLKDSDEQRWARVRMAVGSMEGLPPIEVYKVGDAYFVRDGNHRVSVARKLGADFIQAYVTEVNTKVPLTPSVHPDELIIKEEYADFLERTHLDEIRPDADLAVTAPGKYRDLEEHIAVHRHFMGIEQLREIPYEEAGAHWYDTVYQPVVEIIEDLKILEDFPDRTATDLYLWIAEHRAELKEALGWDVATEAAAEDLMTQYSERPSHVLSRIGGKLLGAVVPQELESGPPPGEWRKTRVAHRRNERLFNDLLVSINGQPSGWRALDQALTLARLEDAYIKGVHVVPSLEAKDTEVVAALREEFERRCREAGIPGALAVDVGKVSTLLCDRSHWTDLLTLSLNFPPGDAPAEKLRSGLRVVVQRCPRPILAVPQQTYPLERALLAYDGSPKSEEALFVATYMAARWQPFSLTVLSVQENNHVHADVLQNARDYLEQYGIRASYVLETERKITDAILQTAEEKDVHLIIVGGYGYNAVLEVMLGSTLDQLLRTTRWPVLISR